MFTKAQGAIIKYTDKISMFAFTSSPLRMLPFNNSAKVKQRLVLFRMRIVSPIYHIGEERVLKRHFCRHSMDRIADQQSL